MSKKIISLLFILILLNSQTVWAVGYRVPGAEETYNAGNWDKEMVYGDRAFGKFTYGVWNVMVGWMELFRQPYEAYVLGDNLLVGFAKGIAYSFADMVGGALNVFTFPITALKIPLPKGGVESREF